LYEVKAEGIDVWEMTKLHQIITAVLQDIVHAGTVSDSYSRDLSRKYSSDPILRQFSVPRAKIKEVTLDLKLALTETQLENGGSGSGFKAETIFNAFMNAIESVNNSSPWQMVINGIFTPEFRTSLLGKFDLNLRTGFVAPSIEVIDVGQNWEEITQRFEAALEENFQVILREVGQEVLDPLVTMIDEVTSAQFLLLKLATGIEQALLNDEEWAGFVETLLVFIQGDTLTNLFQQEINRIISAEPPTNRTSLFDQNFELQTETLTENLRDIFIELLFFVIQESEELLGQIEELGLDITRLQEILLEISMISLHNALSLLARELRGEMIIQRYLHSLEMRLAGDLMEHVRETAVTLDFRRAFQEQCLQFVTTETFQRHLVEEYQQSVTVLFLSQLPDFNQEIRQFMTILDDQVRIGAEVKEMALQTLTGNANSEANIEDKYDPDVEVDSARLQQLPPDIISSLQLTIALDDDLWPTVVADT